MGSRLNEEIDKIMERDPAANSRMEVFLCYPGLHALMIHRVAHRMYAKGHKLGARIVSGFGRWLTGIEIHPGAQIGKYLFIDHGMGVVIGETSIIGDYVTLYQGVTLGGTSLLKTKRHPTLGNNVVIGAGAKVLGNIIIGDNARIGAGSVVTKSVPPGASVVGVPGRIVQPIETHPIVDLEHGNLPDPVAQAVKCILDKINAMDKELEALKASQPVAQKESIEGMEAKKPEEPLEEGSESAKKPEHCSPLEEFISGDDI